MSDLLASSSLPPMDTFTLSESSNSPVHTPTLSNFKSISNFPTPSGNVNSKELDDGQNMIICDHCSKWHSSHSIGPMRNDTEIMEGSPQGQWICYKCNLLPNVSVEKQDPVTKSEPFLTPNVSAQDIDIIPVIPLPESSTHNIQNVSSDSSPSSSNPSNFASRPTSPSPDPNNRVFTLTLDLDLDCPLSATIPSENSKPCSPSLVQLTSPPLQVGEMDFKKSSEKLPVSSKQVSPASSSSSSSSPASSSTFFYVDVPPPVVPYAKILIDMGGLPPFTRLNKRKISSFEPDEFERVCNTYAPPPPLKQYIPSLLTSRLERLTSSCQFCFRPVIQPVHSQFCSMTCYTKSKTPKPIHEPFSPSSFPISTQEALLRKKMCLMFQSEITKFLGPILEMSRSSYDQPNLLPFSTSSSTPSTFPISNQNTSTPLPDSSPATLEVKAKELAKALEDAIFTKYTQSYESSYSSSLLMGKPQEAPYKEKCRTIFMALKNSKLQLLRRNLTFGIWSPNKIIDMDPREFSDWHIKEMERIKQEELAKVVKKEQDLFAFAKKTHKGMVEVKTDVFAAALKKSDSLTPSNHSSTSLPSLTDSIPSADFSFTLSPLLEATTMTESPLPDMPSFSLNDTDLDLLLSRATGRVDSSFPVLPIQVDDSDSPLSEEIISHYEIKDIPSKTTSSLLPSHATEPPQWQGELLLSSSQSLPLVFHQVGGRTLKDTESWADYFSSVFRYDGRIDPITVESYISSLYQSTSREVFFFDVQLDPSDQLELTLNCFHHFFYTLRKSNHYDVVVLENEPKSLFTSMYFLPFRPNDEFPEFFDFFQHNLPTIRNQILIVAVFVAWLPGSQSNLPSQRIPATTPTREVIYIDSSPSSP